MNYVQQKFAESTVIFYDNEGCRISFVDPSPGNKHYEAYREWLAEGNKPEVIDLSG